MKSDENKFVRNKIMKGFIINISILWLLETLADELMNWVDESSKDISNLLNISQSTFIYITIAFYLVISILPLFVSAYMFYKFTNKVLENESKKRLNEHNMIFAAIAHDLKTPMTSIQGFSRALMDEKIPQKDLKSTYNIIYKKTKYTNDLLNTMFEYSKLGTIDYELKKEEFDLTILLRNLIAEHFEDFEDKNIDIEVKIPDYPIPVIADKKEIKRAIENLIINSYTHNKKGSKVYVSLYNKDKSSYISIGDNGEEIPKDKDIFKAFVTSNENRTGGKGTGLGLVISKRIVEKHGGTIELKNTIGKYNKVFTLKI